ncbi:DNA sulfur modification protein DndB [Mesorhizobium cantuariense]|uniref:DNA sulfur modification protein DndB n=1 Tax=Mesorhizobium cantuariense TaxID=1300275 RepID=A0ABV7MHU8_9HYPH
MNAYAFPAIRGVQAGRAYYVVMVPLGAVGSLLRFDDDAVPDELRAQRRLNKSRVPAIARYITSNPKQYVLSALTATIDGGFHFESSDTEGALRSVGTLSVDMTATILVNDGQHRRAAIIEVLRERPHFAHETVAVTLFPDHGLERSRQMFVDLNQHVVKPSRSIRLLYDARDERARLSRAVVDGILLFRDMTDFSRSNLTAGSPKLFAFSNLHTAVSAFASEVGAIGETGEALVMEFWAAVAEAIPDWRLAHNGQVAPADLRREKVHAHGVALEAIAIVGARLFADPGLDWRAAISRLADVDWARANMALWEGRALLVGRINRSRTSVMLTAEKIWSLTTNGADASRQVG